MVIFPRKPWFFQHSDPLRLRPEFRRKSRGYDVSNCPETFEPGEVCEARFFFFFKLEIQRENQLKNVGKTIRKFLYAGDSKGKSAKNVDSLW